MRLEARTINRSKIAEGNADQIAEAIQAACAKGAKCRRGRESRSRTCGPRVITSDGNRHPFF